MLTGDVVNLFVSKISFGQNDILDFLNGKVKFENRIKILFDLPD